MQQTEGRFDGTYRTYGKPPIFPYRRKYVSILFNQGAGILSLFAPLDGPPSDRRVLLVTLSIAIAATKLAHTIVAIGRWTRACLHDRHTASNFDNNCKIALINRAYCIASSKGFFGYGANVSQRVAVEDFRGDAGDRAS
jgi:hypothetical protein